MPRLRKTLKTPRLYHELAGWFHLLTAPQDYKEPAAFYSGVLEETSLIPITDVLEIGSGGGNNASHMKARFKMTLIDISENMLIISRKLNPECEHLQGDMRNVRLNRQFDAVFIHDAISYITTEKDLRATLETSFVHCKPGGSVLFCPDYVKEIFSETTETGGHDDGERGLRYLDWTWDSARTGKNYKSHFFIITRDGDNVEFHTDEHEFGLFPKSKWLDLMTKAGFENAKAVPYPEKLKDKTITPVFTGNRPM
jgi:SAM-dependent methyltransferase